MKTPRAAGLLYLVFGATAMFGIFYIPLALTVPGDAGATADRIRTSESLFRLGIASELISVTLFIFVALALYRLFKRVDQQLASLMVILVALSVPISFVGVAAELGALGLLSGADYLSVFAKPQLDALAFVFLRSHAQAVIVTELFWGLWLFPLGLLAIRSEFVPRLVGVLVIVAGSAYLVVTFTAVLLPAYASVVSAIAVVPEAGELSMIVWLLTTGARVPSPGGTEVAAPA
jgi:hypothetical protein